MYVLCSALSARQMSTFAAVENTPRPTFGGPPLSRGE